MQSEEGEYALPLGATPEPAYSTGVLRIAPGALDLAERNFLSDPLAKVGDPAPTRSPSDDPGPTAAPPRHKRRCKRLVVGVTGHRRGHFTANQYERLEREIAQVLHAISGTFPGTDEFRLISCLASGTDSVAADAALELGWPMEVILPAPRQSYAKDFTHADELEGFFSRLNAAAAVFELPCDKEPVAPVHYERAGRVMLDQCDLLLAAWDGKPGRGRGGTEQILSEAVARHIPVIHIDTSGRRPPMILWSGLDPHGLARTDVTAVTRASLDRLTELNRGIEEEEPRDASGAASLRRRGLSLSALFPLFLCMMGVRRLRASDFRPIDRRLALEAMTRALAGICELSGSFGARMRSLLVPRYAVADAEATHMAQLYRSGFLANYALSALAVMLAMGGLLAPVALQMVLTVGEVSVVVSILWLTHIGQARGWHRRWIEERHLAERLRCLCLTAQLGDVALSFGAAQTRADAELREIARGLGLPSIQVDDTYLKCVSEGLAAMLEDQIAYNAANGRRMYRLDHRLHRIGALLFSLGAATCLSVLLLEVIAEATSSEWLHHLLPRVTLGAAIASALLPAVGAAIYGVRMQGDFVSIANRSQVLAKALRPLCDGLDSIHDAADEHAFDQLRHFLRRASELMNAELAAWRTAHSARPLALPG